MITSSSSPVLSGVYKLSAVVKGDKLIPKIKVSESKGKLTLPGIKQTYRLIDNKSAKPLPILSRFVTRIFRPNSRLSRLIRWQRNKRVILQTLRRFLFKKKPWTGLKSKSIFQTSLRSKSSAILSSICFRIQRSACSMRMNIRCSSRQNFMKFSKNSFQNLQINNIVRMPEKKSRFLLELNEMPNGGGLVATDFVRLFNFQCVKTTFQAAVLLN